MKLVIVKYNAGNIQSVLYALERIGLTARVTDDHHEIQDADKVIFPGVGEASTAMHYLRERGLDTVISKLKQPVLGICLGMQLMCTHSEENDTPCLGIFDEKVKLFQNNTASNQSIKSGIAQSYNKSVQSVIDQSVQSAIKIPQIGWNNIYGLKTPLFAGVTENSYCYFVHSYYAAMGQHTIAATEYIQPYSSALHKDNFYGVQFHPEKSAATGELILRNFINL